MKNNMIPIKNIFGHFKTVCTHKWWVFYYACKLGIPVRGFFHDMSKFSPIEFWESAKYYQGGKSSPINAAKADQGYSLAWQHHKGRNRHHYEHWTDNYDFGTIAIKMPYKYLLEMIADYYGAGRAYGGKSFTLRGEADWWKAKLETIKPVIHSASAKFVLLVMDEFAVSGKVKNINTKTYESLYGKLE